MARASVTRGLTPAEVGLLRPVFGDGVDYPLVRIHRGKWWLLHPRNVIMAPDGDIWIHPYGDIWREDFGAAPASLQALFVHEMTHVWQAQRGGRWFLPLIRHPFCRYRYRLVPGRPFARYGIEQQAEIVRHAWLARRAGRADAALEALLPFGQPTTARPSQA